jgi:hypothetical protein
MTKRLAEFALALLIAIAGLVSAFVVVSSAPAQSRDISSTDTTTVTEPTTTAPLTIPADVTVGGIAVGGMTLADAKTAVASGFATPLRLRLGQRRIMLKPARISAKAGIDDALSQAEYADPATNVPLSVSVSLPRLRKYVKHLAKRFDRKPVDARVFLRHLRPFVTEGVRGRTLRQSRSVWAIKRAFKTGRRTPLKLAVKMIPRHRTKKNYGPIIVIRRGSNRLYLYKSVRFVRRFPVATGQAAYPTPLGHFYIQVMWKDPWWYPPDSSWAQGASPIPPGPGNPLGTRWMGLSAPGVGIHGTSEPSSIGYSESHGCIRMYVPDAEWLFNHVRIGADVFIIQQ